MGNEIACRVRSEGKTASGKALLEAHEIIFRGDLRLRVPLSSLQSVSARNGELHLRWADGDAIFELGEHAGKWANKILHPKSTAEKLEIKLGLAVSLVGTFDDSFVDDLRQRSGRFSDARPISGSDLIFFAAEQTADLERLAKVSAALGQAGILWIVYPKARQEIKEQQVIDAGRRAGLVDVKVVRFSPTHTALKFVHPKAGR
jgi:hypothetical protein